MANEKILSVIIRLREDRAGNERVLNNLRAQVDTGQLSAFTQQTAKLVASQQRLSNDLSRIQNQREAATATHYQRMETLAREHQQRLAQIQKTAAAAPVRTQPAQSPAAPGNAPATRPSSDAREAERLLQARLRLALVNRQFNDAENLIVASMGKLTAGTREHIRLEAQMEAVRQRALQAAQREEAQAARLVQARVRLQLSSRDFAGAERTLQAALTGTAADTDRAIRLEAQLTNVRQRLARASRDNSLLSVLGRNASLVRESGESLQSAGFALNALTRQFVTLGRVATASAINLDAPVNVLRTFEGSSERAEARLRKLIETAQRTPGLTTNLATILDAQLRTASVSVQNIDRILPAIGRLNAIQRIDDPARFAGNLVQLVTQNFERADLKELVGNSPFAGELLKQIFNVDSPTNAKAIRASAEKLGIRTADDFFAAFAAAAEKDPRLASVTESLGTQFDKLRDRISVALRPLGLAIIRALNPLVEQAVPVIERLAARFEALPQSLQTTIVGIGAVAAALGPALIGLGAVTQSIGAVAGLARVFGALAPSTVAVAGGLEAAGAATTATAGALSGLAAPLAVIAGLAVSLYAAWRTNFGGIRDITAEVVDFVTSGIGKIRAYIVTFSPLIEEAAARIQSVLGPVFNFLSNNVRAVLRFALDYTKVNLNVFFGTAGDLVKTGLLLITGRFDEAGRTMIAMVARINKGILDQLVIGFTAAVERVRSFFTDVDNLTGVAQLRGQILGSSLAQGIIAALRAQFPLVAATIDAITNSYGRIRERAQEAGKIRLSVDGNVAGLQTAAEAAGQAYSGRQLNPFVPPKPPGGSGVGGGRGTGSRAGNDDLRRLLDARVQLIEDSLKRESEAYRREADNQQKLLEDQRARGLVTVEQYYAQRLKLTEQGLLLEFNQLQFSADNAAEALRKTKPGSLERVQAETKLLDLYGQQIEKLKELGRLQSDNLRDYKKEFAEIFNKPIDLSQQLPIAQSPQQVPDVVRRAQERLTGLRARATTTNLFGESFDRARIIDDQLRAREIQIQQQVQQGVLTELDGRKALLAVQRQYRDSLLDALNAQLELASAAGKLDDTANLQAQIQQLQTFGQELSNTQRFLKGLGDTLDAGDIFEGLGNGLRDTLRQGFEEGFGSAGVSFGRLLKRMAADFLTSQIVQALRNLFNPQQSAASGAPLPTFSGFLQRGGASGGGSGFQIPSIQLLGPSGPSVGGGGNGGGSFNGGAVSSFAPSGGAGGGVQIPGLPRGITLQNLAALKNTLSRLPLIGRLFGSRATPGALPLSDIQPAQLGGLSADTSLAKAAGVTQASLTPAAPSYLSSLGATGLLAGGGILGSLAGGKSQFGRLLGGLGGTAAAGFLGASGIFGSGIASALPAFFSNPFTAVIGAGLVATALILNARAKRDYRVYKPLILSEYALDVRSDKTLESIRDLGKQKFGREYKNRRLETVKLDDAKAVLLSYADRTGQQGNNKLRSAELSDPNNSRNQFFVRRLNGGVINVPNRGRDYVPLLADGGEYVVNAAITRRVGVERLNALNTGRASVMSNATIVQQTKLIEELRRAAQRGGFFGPLFNKLATNLERSLEVSASGLGSNYYTASSRPLRRLNGGFVPPADHYFPTDEGERPSVRARFRAMSETSSSTEASVPLRSSGDTSGDAASRLEKAAESLERTVKEMAGAVRYLDSIPLEDGVERVLTKKPQLATNAVVTSYRRRDNGSYELTREAGNR
jgi:hypothetical protein